MQLTKSILALGLIFWASSAFAQSTMTDQQVLEYGKQGMAAGKDANTIGRELLARGVTRAQAERVKKLYESEQGQKVQQSAADQQSRTHIIADAEEQDAVSTVDDIVKSETPAAESTAIFGRNIFNNRNLNFAPSENLATPLNYTLGPGDEVIIDIFGVNQTTLRQTISPEGSINVDVLGPLYLNGMTIESANSYLKKRLSAIYAGLGKQGSTDIRLSLGQIRSIQVNVLGEVANPGTYVLSSLSTVFHAMYRAGGIVGTGSLRCIQVNRNNRIVAECDVYDFLVNGSRQGDIRLQEGDVILVKPYSTVVNLKGNVKRPMYFELKEGETLKTLLNYAGGFAKGAYTNSVTVVRQTGRQYEVCTVDEFEYGNFQLKDGDEIEVGKLLSRFENRVRVEGAVYKAGLYQLGNVTTVRNLVEKADGVLPEAFLSRAVLHRERPDRSLEIVSVDLKGIMDGSAPDIALHNNDVLFVPSVYDLKDVGTVTINGEVTTPGTFPYADNMTVEDIVLMAGGLTDAASIARVDVTRRIKDADATEAGKELAEHFSLAMKAGFVVDENQGFILHPYDVVTVRRSPGYHAQQFVTIDGEANFIGDFPLVNKEMRVSELVKLAGGPTVSAYIEGAHLERTMTARERQQFEALMKKMESASRDTINREAFDMGNIYNVAIDLQKAIENPGSNADVVLREGDRLVIPVYENVVRVNGAVLAANSVTYDAKKRAKWYIENAGGYADNARKSRAYCIEMNGHIRKIKRGSKIAPGSEIIVPQKQKRTTNLSNILGIATSSASIASMLGTLYNIIRR